MLVSCTKDLQPNPYTTVLKLFNERKKMNTNYHLDTAYIAGLFDGEGSLTYKKYKEKKKSGTYDCWRIVMEISMTDKNVIELVHETLMVGTVRPKKVPKGMKPQWRWRLYSLEIV